MSKSTERPSPVRTPRTVSPVTACRQRALRLFVSQSPLGTVSNPSHSHLHRPPPPPRNLISHLSRARSIQRTSLAHPAYSTLAAGHTRDMLDLFSESLAGRALFAIPKKGPPLCPSPRSLTLMTSSFRCVDQVACTRSASSSLQVRPPSRLSPLPPTIEPPRSPRVKLTLSRTCRRRCPVHPLQPPRRVPRAQPQHGPVRSLDPTRPGESPPPAAPESRR